MKDFQVKDLGLSAQGFKNIELAERNMGALLEVRRRFVQNQIFKGLRIGMALHVTKETAVLVRTLRAGGAEVWLASCNPLSTQDDVAAALAKEGVHVFGYKGESDSDYYQFLKCVIESKPNLTIDDGCDLVAEIHKNYPELLPGIIGGCEETTTGIIRLKAMEKAGALKYPVIAVNDNKTKHLMDNYYGTGQSTLDGIMRACNFMFAGKTVVVAGYGSCGKGVALRARGLGARVIVTEVDNFRALQAVMDGWSVMPMDEAARVGDLFITVTGDVGVVRAEHVRLMKDGAILANSGHFNCEIDIDGIEKMCGGAGEEVRPFMKKYEVQTDQMLNDNLSKKSQHVPGNGGVGAKKIYILADGRLVNLAAAEGHPSEVMSLSFCGQALACEYLVKKSEERGVGSGAGILKPGVHTLPDEIDDYISALQLETMGVEIDKLTPEQKKYLASWENGT